MDYAKESLKLHYEWKGKPEVTPCAAAVSITKLLLSAVAKDNILCDCSGAIYEGRSELNWIKAEMAKVTTPENRTGSPAEILPGADVFIGVSALNIQTREIDLQPSICGIIDVLPNPSGDAARVQVTNTIYRFFTNVIEAETGESISYPRKNGGLKVPGRRFSRITAFSEQIVSINPPWDIRRPTAPF